MLLFDLFVQFAIAKTERMFSTELVQHLNAYSGRALEYLLRGKPIDER